MTLTRLTFDYNMSGRITQCYLPCSPGTKSSARRTGTYDFWVKMPIFDTTPTFIINILFTKLYYNKGLRHYNQGLRETHIHPMCCLFEGRDLIQVNFAVQCDAFASLPILGIPHYSHSPSAPPPPPPPPNRLPIKVTLYFSMKK